MYRLMIALAVGIAIVAVGAAVVTIVASRDKPADEPQVAAAPESPPREAAPAPATEPAAAPVRRVPQEPAPAPVEENPAADESAEAAQPADEAGSAPAKERIAALLSSLGPDEQRELQRQLMQRRMNEFRERSKYMLPSDNKLRALRWYKNGQFRLNEAQEQRASELAEVLRPQIDAALQGVWQREEELRNQAIALSRDGRVEDARPLFTELQELQKQIGEVKEGIDQQYQQLLTSVLTPEQIEALGSEDFPYRRVWTSHSGPGQPGGNAPPQIIIRPGLGE